MDVEQNDGQTLTSDLQALSVSDPLSNQFSSLNDLCYEASSLQELASRGSWRSILDKVVRARKLSLLQKPHEHLIYLCYNVLALTKLRKYGEASEELDSLEDFDSARYKYETHPEHYPNRSGSMVPFALRWIHAEIPQRLGKRQETLDRLYSLLDFVRTKLKEKESKNMNFCVDRWKKREAFLISSISSHHLSHKEFSVCLALLRQLLNSDPSNPILLSKLGYIQMQLGDLEGSKALFNRVETLMTEGNPGALLDEVQFKNLVNRNKALIYLVGKDYVSAVREYEECIERDPTDVVAINNKALCLMYLRDLSDSIKVLENALERIPTVALNETIVVNLCSMYELAYVNHSDIKRTLSNWIARVAPDDFDSSCTRI
ncbi:PREDICTED: trafficking protein particle complex subunit 12 [Nelumbo nucifera]|uniref:Trafficking protein particle complex subunit 12 n=1 Tax=Nelumbo nucifera TaxID=4432 RepID=A0A1U8ANP9_NELNU|nr:PREDICTED: trafficking protein particle complex subunit 12 [Nelumbo nucifera]XP_019054757.1 PREDICTED: trafficking protein particle complex subunit 12 [Nelumbo nucifera]